MKNEIYFRASALGKCSIAQVANVFGAPEWTDPAVEPFLEDGHWLQQSVLHFLRDESETHGVYKPLDHHMFYEEEGSFKKRQGKKFPYTIQIIGHPDGFTSDLKAIIEVKALSSKSFNSIGNKKSWDWKKKFYSYYVQCQTYLNLVYREEGMKPEEAYIVFKNRDTGKMIGGFPGIEHDAYEYRPNMVIKKDKKEWDRILKKQIKIAEHIIQETEPAICDAVGYCFFCGTTGQTPLPKRSVYVNKDTTARNIALDAEAFNEEFRKRRTQLKSRINNILKKYSTDHLEVELLNDTRNQEVNTFTISRSCLV